jgi:hypothetical protein
MAIIRTMLVDRFLTVEELTSLQINYEDPFIASQSQMESSMFMSHQPMRQAVSELYNTLYLPDLCIA